MGRGESFGELALMYSTPRTATCKAATELRLWALDRMSFKVILMQTTVSRRQQYKQFLENVPLLHELTEYEVLTVADALQEEVYEANTNVCEQGDVGEAFYIIKEMDATGDVVEVARLSQGHYFGEVHHDISRLYVSGSACLMLDTLRCADIVFYTLTSTLSAAATAAAAAATIITAFDVLLCTTLHCTALHCYSLH
eukprot:16378-Heterococcus_DN1.PRE.3